MSAKTLFVVAFAPREDECFGAKLISVPKNNN